MPAALPADLHAAAVELWRDTGLTRPWNDPVHDLQRAAAGPSSAVLGVWTEDRQLRGTVMVGHDGHRGWVYYLAVHPRHRREGLGRALMHAAEGWLVERGVPKLNLMVRRGNEQVLAFYASLGYRDGEVVVLGRFLDERPS